MPMGAVTVWSSSESRGAVASSPPASPRTASRRGTSLSGRQTPVVQAPGPARQSGSTVPGTPPPPSPRLAVRRSGTATPGTVPQRNGTGTPAAPARPLLSGRPRQASEASVAQDHRRRAVRTPSAPVVAAHSPAGGAESVPPPAAAAPVVAPPAPAQPPEPLAPGVRVQVKNHKFRITVPLGEGSFGTVWGAECEAGAWGVGNEVALKEIHCHSQSALADAVFEGEILRALGPKMRGPSPSVGSGQAPSTSRPELDEQVAMRIPSLIDMEVIPLSQESSQVRIAMSRVPGEPVSSYLERHRLGHIRERAERHRRFAEAAFAARELILQLAPVFERIVTRTYHRDVTPRNILVEMLPGNRPSFGLIDFGLAVDSTQWRIGLATVKSMLPSDGTPAWQHFGVAGDGRYWPVASWYMFEMGAEKVSRCAGLELEYKMHLDLHSLGLSAVQVLVELCPQPYSAEDDPNAASMQDHDEYDDLLLHRLWCLRTAWQQYWDEATKFWQCIYETFRTQGDFKALKVAYVKADVHETVRRSLITLRTALTQVREAVQSSTISGLRDVPGLVDALLLMVGIGEKDAAIGWGTIREVLERTEDERRPQSRVTRPVTSSSAAKVLEVLSPPSTASPVSPVSSVSVQSSCEALSPACAVAVASADKAAMAHGMTGQRVLATRAATQVHSVH